MREPRHPPSLPASGSHTVSDHPTLSELDNAQPFTDRHIGPDADAVATMLETLGHERLASLMDAAVPGGIRSVELLTLPSAASELQVDRELRELRGPPPAPAPQPGLRSPTPQTP